MFLKENIILNISKNGERAVVTNGATNANVNAFAIEITEME